MGIYEQMKKNFIIADAYEDWSAYRNTLTDYLIGLADGEEIPLNVTRHMYEEISLPTLAIIGAGRLNDLDLQRLLPYFSHITLMDMDSEVMEASVPEIESAKVDTQIFSLTGIYDEDYKVFAEKLQRYLQEEGGRMTPESFCKYAMDCVKEQYRNKSIPEYRTYDYVWCFGVHSQLQGMYGYIYQTFLSYLCQEQFEEEEEVKLPFLNLLKEYNRQLIPAANDTLLRMARKTCIIGNEWDVIERPEELYRMKEVPDCAIEGAYGAITDIRKRDIAVLEKLLLWPFDVKRAIYYEMLIQQIDRTKEVA